VDIPVPRKPLIKAATKRLPLEKPVEEHVEPKEIQAQKNSIYDKDK